MSPAADFPLPAAQVDEQLAEARALADRDYERFGWNGPAKVRKKPGPKPKASADRS